MGFYLLAGITFLSAFLLFQIELIIAKLFLPSYGGSYLVWGACVVFFQGILLAGYIFAHQFITKKGIGNYLKIHLVLLLIPFVFFPGRMLQIPHDESNLPLVVDIFIKLLFSIGPVFFALSTVSLVTQSWLAANSTKSKDNPYALYAVSNLGSFLGLLTYPFIFELYLTNTSQLNIWRLTYVVLVGLNLLAFKMIPLRQAVAQTPEKIRYDWSKALGWLSLSAAGVVLFLSVTNIITYEITPAPLLWIIPLSIYLFSFILNFKNKPFTPSWIRNFIFLIVGVSVVYYFTSKIVVIPVMLSTIIFNILLLLLCMFTQGELIRTKPDHKNLTFFYVMISLGGFLGGILTSWIIPLISTNLVEFLIGLLLLALGSQRKVLMIMALIAIICSSPIENAMKKYASVVKKRNYYGIYDIFDKKEIRIFLHGTTLHGVELLEPSRKWIPIGYYSPTSPLGDVLTKDLLKVNRIGGVGLGAGTIAMYTRGDCPLDFYELDPDVVSLAKNYFSYLALAPGQVNIFLGDARISLEKQKDVIYDVLIIDAFGGDSIPTHLVNRDVAAIYKKHLSKEGLIFFHIPNRYFDLKPILAHMAEDLGAQVAYKETSDAGLTMRTVWAVMTWDQDKYQKLLMQYDWKAIDVGLYPAIRPWSDDYSTILPIIRWDELQFLFQYLKLTQR